MTGRLVHASCLDPTLGLPSMGAASVDHIITDPPYSAHVHAKVRSAKMASDDQGARGGADVRRVVDLGFKHLSPSLMYACAFEFARVARRWVLIFTDVENVSAWRSAVVDAGLDYVRCGAWIKRNATPQFSGDRPAVGFEAIVIAHPRGKKRWNGGGGHALWEVPIVLNRSHNEARVHSAQKPLPLMEALVRQFTDPGETILDPFAGSGTTLVAAKRLGRIPIGYEVDGDHADAAQRRLSETLARPGLFGEVPA